MYKSLLIFKYLRKRRIAWVSLIAVMLCTTMVLVVISVMGGWLTMFKEKFRGMSGDIVVARESLTGFGGYERMLADIRKLPEVDQALPLLRTFGLLNINNYDIEGVQVVGMDLAEFSRFNNFRQSLWRQYQQPTSKGETPMNTASFDLLPDVPYAALRPRDPQAEKRPGMIVGGPIVGVQKDDKGKTIDPTYVYDKWCRLEVVPMATDVIRLEGSTPSANIYWIVDTSQTQLYQLDAQNVYVPFDVLQKDLQMSAQTFKTIDAEGKEVERTRPARCSELQINLKPGSDRVAAIKKVDDIVQRVRLEVEPSVFAPVRVSGWEEQRTVAGFLHAVENEKSLVTFLFAIVSVVAIFLIFCILYMIVVEKTRDIGIIKSVGATSGGVATIFLGYGLAIGVVGGVLGFALAFLIVRNINELHTKLGELFGIRIWDPKVYAFDKIPDRMDPTTCVIVVAVAILSAVIGAVVPALRASRLNPVEALRFE